MAVRTRKRLLRPRHRHRHHADRAGLAAWCRQTTGFVVQPNKAVVGANAFAHASRHPPGRRAQGARHLRDHARRGRGLDRQQDRAGQAVGPQRVQAAPAGAGHRAGVARPKSTPRSPASRSWPTARARSSTRTSWRWCRTKQSAHEQRALPLRVAVAALRDRRAAAARGRVHGRRQRSARARRDGNGPVDAIAQGDRSRRCKAAPRCCCIRSMRSRPAPRSQGEVTVRLSQGGPHRQRRRRRPGHRRGVGQGLPVGA